jgi:hypothetical protein
MTIARDLSKILDANGDLTIDTSTLFVDSSTNRVGIGTTSPDELLDLGTSLPQNLRAGLRTYLGVGRSDGGSILGHSVKADTDAVSGSSPMIVTETNSGGGAPSAIRMQSGNIQFHTAGSGTLGATFDSERMRIDSSGNVGIGTSSPSGKLHISSLDIDLYLTGTRGTGNTFSILSSGTNADLVRITDVDRNQSLYLFGHDRHVWDTSGSERMRIDSSGNVGIGTSSPSYKVHVAGTGSQSVYLNRTDASTSGSLRLTDGNSSIDVIGTGSKPMYLGTNGNINLTIDSSGNVGIGTSSPTGSGQVLHLNSSSTVTDFHMTNSTTGSASTDGLVIRQSGLNSEILNREAGNTIFYNNGAESMRIDSSGVVNIGTTTPVAGATALSADGISGFQNQGNYAININRQTNDGDLINFQRGGSTVGSIASAGGNDLEVIASNGIWLKNGNGAYAVWDGTNAFRPSSDNVYDIGRVTLRWDDIYATNGTIQTSDQNEKQSIQSLTSSEIAVAKRISKLFKTFKWNSAVEEKGDSARTHTGVIAQDVQQAFADEGLDAGNYGMFMSNTWWEKERVIPAVEEITDEEGNITQEAQPERTVIDKWEVESEAPEGAVQKTRLGIRYPELLSFVSSAFEQRLTDIETRLTALET